MSGEMMKRIKEIEKSGNFTMGIALPDLYQIIGKLDDHERAVLTYIEELKTAINNTATTEEIEQLKYKHAAALGYFDFLVVDSQELWELRDKILDINKGLFIIIRGNLNNKGSSNEPNEVRNLKNALAMLPRFNTIKTSD